MAVKTISQEYGFQPESARARTLEAISVHGPVTTEQLINLSPYISPVYAQLARTMVKNGLLYMEKVKGKNLYTITDLGKEVVNDIAAISPSWCARRLKTFYRDALDQIQFCLKEGMVDSVLQAVANAMEQEYTSYFRYPITHAYRDQFYADLRALMPKICELTEEYSLTWPEDQTGFALLWVNAIRNELATRNIDMPLSKSFLDRIMIEKLT